MAYTSGFGIACWALMLGLAVLPSNGVMAQPAPTPATVIVTISGLRDDRGVVRLVLCPAGSHFPDCGSKGVAQTATIKDRTATASFNAVPPGRYAIAAFHDENGNGRLDTFVGIPREGFGFSRNPAVRPAAPRFSECDFDVAGNVSEQISMKYLL